jgi:hypothetical protein
MKKGSTAAAKPSGKRSVHLLQYLQELQLQPLQEL